MFKARSMTTNPEGKSDLSPSACKDYNFLFHEDTDIFLKMRRNVISAVLHTDMTNHFSIVDKINNQIAGKSWDDITEDMQWEVLMFMLHLADISNPAKGDPMFKLWTDRCLEEFFAQGDLERERGMPVSPNCDRDTTQRPDSQIGFIQYVVKPAYTVLAKVIPKTGETVLPVIESNLNYWKKE